MDFPNSEEEEASGNLVPANSTTIIVTNGREKISVNWESIIMIIYNEGHLPFEIYLCGYWKIHSAWLHMKFISQINKWKNGSSEAAGLQTFLGNKSRKKTIASTPMQASILREHCVSSVYVKVCTSSFSIFPVFYCPLANTYAEVLFDKYIWLLLFCPALS